MPLPHTTIRPMLPPSHEIELLLTGEPATAALAAAIAPQVGPGFVLYLSGDLGAGKTTFTRALLRALGHTGRVRSPTFTLAETYNLSNFELYHFDFYRFSTDSDWRDAGFDEQVGGDAATVIEWPELGGAGMPSPDLWLRLAPADPDDAASGPRIASLSAGTERGRQCLKGVADSVRLGLLAGVSLRAASPAPRSR